MTSSFTTRFYLRRDQVNKDGTATIMVRVTVNGERAVFSTKLSVAPEAWDAQRNCAVGTSKAIRELNNTLDDIKATIRNHYYELERYDTLVTAEKVRNAFLGINARSESLMSLFKDYIDECNALEGISRATSTVKKYERCYHRMQDFLKVKYNITDIAIQEISNKFIIDFECYLRTVCGVSENTAARFMQTFKRIIIRARNNGYIKADPFANYKIRIKSVDRGYLSRDELERIAAKKFVTKRLEKIRDIFLFSCYTGLAYVDIFELKPENIHKSFDGNEWIMTHRHKTKTPVNVPLLDIPKKIIEKYKGVSKKGQLLPVPSNQKVNQYLAEIAEACEIDKRVTFHMARHTFATTVTLAQGVPIESVSKMLGHTNIQTTQIYARITNEKISQDMAILAAKLKEEEAEDPMPEAPKRGPGRPPKKSKSTKKKKD